VRVAGALLVIAVMFAWARALDFPSVRVQVGGYDRAALGGEWPRAVRADVDGAAAGGDALSFYYRAAPWTSALRLPLVSEGPVRVDVRATARIRSGISVSREGLSGTEVIVPHGRWERFPGPWARYAMDAGGGPGGQDLDLRLAFRPRPLVGRNPEQLARPDLLIDFMEVSSPAGLRLGGRAIAAAAAVPAVAALFLVLVGAPPAAAVLGSAIVAAVVALALHAAPTATITAIPRLLPFALLAGAAAALLSHGPALARARPWLAALTAAAAAAHGSVVFFPDHNPPDIDIHVRRTLDLATVPLEYQAWLRYGSQLPTASQDIGSATAALGERTLIPYSPLPYVLYYALHACGLDLYWAMTVLNATLAALLIPLAFLTARRLWDEGAAHMAAALAALDLALWHHLGRSHAPAIVGAVLGAAALLHLARNADAMRRPRVASGAAALLAAGALGYSSFVVLLGLFGLLLLTLFAVDARALPPPDRVGLAATLVAGGLIAGALFYFHYAPGLLHGALGVEAEPDLFPGRTFFIFHNESRQSLRLWALGLWIPLAAGVVATPFALRAAPGWSRPVLVAWLLAWALVMLLKEPFLLPRLLRWAKEDLFLGPLLGLLVAGGLSTIPDRRWRSVAAAVVLGVAAWLQVRDFGHHANSLRL
jgi:hypothetical protein